MTDEVVIKSVFCSYRGILVVHDIQGNRVTELCGELTLDKYYEIEKLFRADITEFDGRDTYKRIVAELEKKQEEEAKQQAQTQQAANQAAATQSPPTSTSVITIENTSKKTLPVNLFGAYKNSVATNFGLENDITIDQPNNYRQLLAQLLVKPVIVKAIHILNNTGLIGSGIEVIRTTPTGAQQKQVLNPLAGFNPIGVQNTVSQLNNLSLTLDGYTEFNFDLGGNSKITIKLFY